MIEMNFINLKKRIFIGMACCVLIQWSVLINKVQAHQERNDFISQEKAIEVAKAKAMSLGYDPIGKEVVAKIENSSWNKYLPEKKEMGAIREYLRKGDLREFYGQDWIYQDSLKDFDNDEDKLRKFLLKDIEYLFSLSERLGKQEYWEVHFSNKPKQGVIVLDGDMTIFLDGKTGEYLGVSGN